jgi:ribokinase
MVDKAGNNMISVAPGANANLRSTDLDSILHLFEGASHVLCQLECPVELFVGAAERARAAGITTILNPAPARPLPPDACALINIITPNETELKALTDADGSEGDSVEERARFLITRGVDHVIATLGDRGATWVSSQGTVSLPARPVVARDTTGAGDAFNAGLVAELARGATMAEAIDLGMRAGAFCATKLGVIDGLPTRSQLDDEIS